MPIKLFANDPSPSPVNFLQITIIYSTLSPLFRVILKVDFFFQFNFSICQFFLEFFSLFQLFRQDSVQDQHLYGSVVGNILKIL